MPDPAGFTFDPAKDEFLENFRKKAMSSLLYPDLPDDVSGPPSGASPDLGSSPGSSGSSGIEMQFFGNIRDEFAKVLIPIVAKILANRGIDMTQASSPVILANLVYEYADALEAVRLAKPSS